MPAKKGRTEVKILDKSNLHQSSSLSWDVCRAEAEDHGGGGTAHQEANERFYGKSCLCTIRLCNGLDFPVIVYTT